MNINKGEIICIDKPYRMSSFGALAHVRYLISQKMGVKRVKVGHAGTLDPLATGVLVLCTGKMTKNIEQLQYHTKEYTATLQLGATTASYDREHTVNATYPTGHITRELILETLPQFVGEIQLRCRHHADEYSCGVWQRNLHSGLGSGHRAGTRERSVPHRLAPHKGRGSSGGKLY